MPENVSPAFCTPQNVMSESGERSFTQDHKTVSLHIDWRGDRLRRRIPAETSRAAIEQDDHAPEFSSNEPARNGPITKRAERGSAAPNCEVTNGALIGGAFRACGFPRGTLPGETISGHARIGRR